MFDDVIQEAIDKTMRELAKPPESARQNSRNWTDPEGYRFLFPWSNAVLLRHFIREFTRTLPKSEYRRKAQVDDAIRSVVRNIEEGFKRSTTSEYLQFLGYSQGSLEEVKGDVRESTEDGFLKSVPGSSLAKLGISLRNLNLALREPNKLKEVRGSLEDGREESPDRIPSILYHPLTTPACRQAGPNHPLTTVSLGVVRGSLEDGKGKSAPSCSSSLPYHPLPSPNHPLTPTESRFAYRPLTVLYPPLASVEPSDLTYEIFMELINKTDFLIRQLVVSLETKLNTNNKGYQVDQIRLNRKSTSN